MMRPSGSVSVRVPDAVRTSPCGGVACRVDLEDGAVGEDCGEVLRAGAVVLCSEVQAKGAVEVDALLHALGVQDDQPHPDPRRLCVHVLILPVPQQWEDSRIADAGSSFQAFDR